MQKSILEQIYNYTEDEKELILKNAYITYEAYSTVGGKIDDSRTYLNYSFITREEVWIEKRLKDLGFNEDDECIATSVFRLPVNYASKETEFFQFVFIEVRNNVGEDNLIQAVVHKDQKVPHIHLKWIVEEDKDVRL